MKDVKLEFKNINVEVKDGWLDIWDDENCYTLKPKQFKKLLKAINYTHCCKTLPNSKEPISLIIKQIEENANRIIEEVKQVNKFTVNKKTIEEITKPNRLK